jgi:hypothetical protein
LTKLTLAGLAAVSLYQLTSSSWWSPTMPFSTAEALPVIPCDFQSGESLSASAHMKLEIASGPTSLIDVEPAVDCVGRFACSITYLTLRRGCVAASLSTRAYDAASTPLSVNCSFARSAGSTGVNWSARAVAGASRAAARVRTAIRRVFTLSTYPLGRVR